MRYSNWALLSGLLALSTACTSREPSEIQWRGQSFREVRTIKSLPLAIQSELGVGRPGLEGIADRGGRFNETDVVDGRFPRRRFAVAGLSSEEALVAVERGGYAYFVQVFLIPLASDNAKPKEIWTLPIDKPNSLKELVTTVSGVAPDTFHLDTP